MKRLAIHSVPRSGSTWLGSVFDSCPNVAYRYQPLFSYAFKDALNENSSKKAIIDFFNKIYKSNDDFINQVDDKRDGKVPIFEKETITAIVYKEVRYHHILKHLLESDQDLKVILLIRNPKSVIQSWLSAPREFRPDLGWKELEEWKFAPKKNLGRKEEFNGYEKWKEATLLFRGLKEMYPARVHLIEYKELLRNTLTVVEEAFKFSDLPVTEQTISFLTAGVENHSKDSYSVFKSKKDDTSWDKLNPTIIHAIDEDLKGTDLERYLQ